MASALLICELRPQDGAVVGVDGVAKSAAWVPPIEVEGREGVAECCIVDAAFFEQGSSEAVKGGAIVTREYGVSLEDGPDSGMCSGASASQFPNPSVSRFIPAVEDGSAANGFITTNHGVGAFQ